MVSTNPKISTWNHLAFAVTNTLGILLSFTYFSLSGAVILFTCYACPIPGCQISLSISNFHSDHLFMLIHPAEHFIRRAACQPDSQ
jgi:hypothetical protein